MTDYVVGFLLHRPTRKLFLIRKLKPQWQAGLLKGIGGKIEPGETPLDAMWREWIEETGIPFLGNVWHEFARHWLR